MSFKKRISLFFLVVLFSAVAAGSSFLITLQEKRSSRLETNTILFTGDMFLGRNVEQEINKYGPAHIFKSVKDFHSKHAFVVGNFEATIPKVHVPTPHLTFQFSVSTTSTSLLKDAKVTHVSLANNHALDHGHFALLNTFEVLQQFGITPFGDPRSFATTSHTSLRAGNKEILLVGVHAVSREPELKELKELLNRHRPTDIQIAYVHWGTEYESVHDKKQERIARLLVEMGFDAVVGHHPHVIQDIELYKGVPIFYSLGNYVFDQYWNAEVQTGLLLSVVVGEHGLEFTLVPVGSERSVPFIQDVASTTKILDSIATRSDKSLRERIRAGKLLTEYKK